MPKVIFILLLALVAVGAGFWFYSSKTQLPVLPSDSTRAPDSSSTQVTAGPTTEGGDTQATFGGVSLKLEYATTVEARGFGLGGRESLAPDEAMLFVFPTDDYWGFWMNDMLIPIDIFWLDSKGQVVSIEENVDPSTYPDVFYPVAPARYVLETATGFADAHNVATGTPLLLKNFPSVTE